MAKQKRVRANIKFDADEVKRITSPLELDLVAAFSQMREEITLLVDRAIDEGWSPDQLINHIEEVIT